MIPHLSSAVPAESFGITMASLFITKIYFQDYISILDNLGGRECVRQF